MNPRVAVLCFALFSRAAFAGITMTDSDVPLLDDSPAATVQTAAGELTDEQGRKLYVGEGLFLNKSATVKIGKMLGGSQAEIETLKSDNAKLVDSQGFPAWAVILLCAASVAGGLVLGEHFIK